MRTCIACRVTAPANELIRVRLVEGRLTTDRSAPGRGAWIGPSEACLERAIRRGALSRALREPVPEPAIAALRRAWPSIVPDPSQTPPSGCPEQR